MYGVGFLVAYDWLVVLALVLVQSVCKVAVMCAHQRCPERNQLK